MHHTTVVSKQSVGLAGHSHAKNLLHTAASGSLLLSWNNSESFSKLVQAANSCRYWMQSMASSALDLRPSTVCKMAVVSQASVATRPQGFAAHSNRCMPDELTCNLVPTLVAVCPALLICWSKVLKPSWISSTTPSKSVTSACTTIRCLCKAVH